MAFRSIIHFGVQRRCFLIKKIINYIQPPPYD